MEKDVSRLAFNSIKEILSKFSHIDCPKKVSRQEELIKIFRSIFGDKYEKNSSCDVVLDDSSMKLKTLKLLFESLDCFWLDLIGCNNFSLSTKQLFYTTISASGIISNSRIPIVATYNELCRKDIPIDIFLQLFYSKKSNNIILDIQANGLVVEYDTEKDLNSNNGLYFLHLSNETVSLFSHDADRCFLPTYESLNEEIDKLVTLINTKNILLEKKSLLYETCRLNKCLYDKLKFLYFIPIPSPKSMGYIGHFCCGTGRRLTMEEIENMSALSFTLLYPFVSSSKSLYDKIVINKEAIKSAISAIMARNMSHNLGSHFISNTKHYFSNLAEIDENEQRQKDYRGIRHTLQYIQERMDFIATIVSTDRFPYGPVNVKSQIFDELTPDEFGGRHNKATTNFLLDYIVFSEDISKQSNLSSSSIKLSLKLISDNGIKFGGQNNQENQKAKEEFAKLNLAVPGGILGRHAIFTIIENVIRNSAKHDKESIPEDGLTVSIKIDKDHLVIFDNKKNANKKISGVVLKKELNERYAEIKILSDGAIDKSNKGLKEILISALWLNNYSLADWFGEYESIPKEDKIEKLSEVLRVVAVDDNGDMTDDGENLGYYIALDRYEEIYYIKDDVVVDNKINYSSVSRIKADIIVANKDYEVFIDGNARQNEDVDINPNDVLKLSNIYPRFYENRDGGELPQVGEMMKAIIERNTGIMVKELNDINIHIEPKGEVRHSDVPNLNHCIWYAKSDAAGIKKNDILYKRHLSTLKTEEMDRLLAAYIDAAYIDSISGGDFTGTITQPFFLQDEFNRLKVIESALTEFVIIDERIFKNYGHGFKKINASSESGTNKLLLDADKIFNEVEELFASGKSCEDIGDDISAHYHIELHALTLMENDKVLIRKDIDKKVAQKNSESASKTERMESNSDSFIALHKMIERRKLHIYDIDKNGNVMNLEGKTVANVTDRNEMKKLCSPTFLSIHLSIIEKITKENNNMKASEVMNNLKTIFGDTKYVTIHSGRGNLSAELEKELKDYAFLSLSAIQAAMDDSKYFLSQLLYNNCYIGKGRLNHK